MSESLDGPTLDGNPVCTENGPLEEINILDSTFLLLYLGAFTRIFESCNSKSEHDEVIENISLFHLNFK